MCAQSACRFELSKTFSRMPAGAGQSRCLTHHSKVSKLHCMHTKRTSKNQTWPRGHAHQCASVVRTQTGHLPSVSSIAPPSPALRLPFDTDIDNDSLCLLIVHGVCFVMMEIKRQREPAGLGECALAQADKHGEVELRYLRHVLPPHQPFPRARPLRPPPPFPQPLGIPHGPRTLCNH